MSRARNPAREKALKLWVKSGKEMKLSEIAEEVGVSPEMVRKWKHLDKWDEIAIRPRKRGAPPGNKNAIGNKGGSGAPEGNDYALKHGFFSRILPEEVQSIVEEIEMKDPIDILWDNIVIQAVAVARAQKLNYVKDQQDETKVLTKQKDSDTSTERVWEYQHAWDKHNSFMKAQSTAMNTLQSLIRRYTEMVNEYGTEEQRLRVEKLKLQLKALGSNDEQKRKLEDFL